MWQILDREKIHQEFKKKKQQHYETEKQFEKAQEYRKTNPLSIKNNQLTTHTQAIYTSRLLNPFTKNLSKYDNINNNNYKKCVIYIILEKFLK